MLETLAPLLAVHLRRCAGSRCACRVCPSERNVFAGLARQVECVRGLMQNYTGLLSDRTPLRGECTPLRGVEGSLRWLRAIRCFCAVFLRALASYSDRIPDND